MADTNWGWDEFDPPPTAPSPARPVPLAWGLPAPQRDLRLAEGEAVSLAFAPLAGTDPAALGTQIQFAARHPLTGAAVLTAAGAVVDAEAGTFTVALSAAATAALDPLLTYRWDVFRTAVGAAARLAHGTLRAARSQQ